MLCTDLVATLCVGLSCCRTPAPAADAGADAGTGSDSGGGLDRVGSPDASNPPDAVSGDSAVVAEDSGPPRPEAGLIGGVEVLESRLDSDTSALTSYVLVQGLYQSPSPGYIPGVCDRWLHDVATEVGACRYLVSALQGYCEPACDPWSHYCSEAGECVPFPLRQSAGTLTLTGLNAAVEMAPSGTNVYLQQDTLPADLFGASAQVALTASGGDIPAFSVAAEGVADLEPALSCAFDLQPDQDLVVTWTPAAGGARVQWLMNNGLHIGYGPMILCESDDTGALTVPAALIARYLSERWISSETFVLKRYHRQQVDVGDGHLVTLQISSVRMCDYD